MSNIIKIKRGSTGGVVPSGLTFGELAVNITDRKMFVGGATGNTIELLGGGVVAFSGVTGINGLTGNVSITAGTNITLVQSGNLITLSAAGAAASAPPLASNSITGAASFNINDFVVSTTGHVGLTGTIARTNTAQTFTGLQTFSTGISAANLILTSNTITLSAGGVVTLPFPSVNSTLVTTTGTQTLTNKTLTNPSITNPSITTNIITTSTGNTVTIPNVTSTLVNLSTSQTLTNKTLTTPRIQSFTMFSGGDWTGTLNLPDTGSGETLVGKATTDTLTNKTINAANNSISGITNGSLANSSVTVTAGSGLAGGGSVSLGGSVTLTNAGVTGINGLTGNVSITAGTNITLVQSGNLITLSAAGAAASAPPLASNSITGAASFSTNDFVIGTTGHVGLTGTIARTNTAQTFTGLQTLNAGITSTNLFVGGGGATFASNVSFSSTTNHTGLATFAGGITSSSLSIGGGATFSGNISASGNVVFNAVSAVFGASAANTTPIIIYKDNSTDNPAVDDGFGNTSFDTPNNKVPLTLSFTEVYDPNTGLTASVPGSTMIRVRDQTAGLDTFTVTDLGSVVCGSIVCSSITPTSYSGNLDLGLGNFILLNWDGTIPAPTVLSIYDSNTSTNTLTLKGDGTFSQLTTSGLVQYGAASVLNDSYTFTTSATGATTMASFTKTQYRSFEFDIQGARGTTGPYQFTKIIAVHDGTTVTSTQLSNISTGVTAGTYTVDISGTIVRLRVTPFSATSTVFKTTVKAIPV